MGEPQISSEALQKAHEIYNELSEARSSAQNGEFLTLQNTLRRLEHRAKGLHYSEKLAHMDERIAALEAKLNNHGKTEQ